ncbi:type VII secretion protein EccCa [Cellulomonas chengniuliangii]|uniref:Type VII secretion protein EccCa n=1 Tax=Cellulomonas chengniuliangii TaxID=2968084 RepID=A0ABY5L2S9_9CELL|nr:type VII secretion protein EccCa [Cellulomonas chengniuliangii]MCC2309574.1 type VII secretion protein EccCa [Cellulomonas chengniuliangii]MCC2316845.1 type VII secretion protein EccCa [Cellulomonas chengniuliangii]UUI74873.1 type VII secretion protein EccCa [Cellulomonas chengniuliangii]
MSIAPHRAHRVAPPSVPSGRVTLQAPPEIQASDGVSGLLATMLPMLGSVGSIVFVAVSSPGPRGMIAAGMFLVASLGFVGVNGWRQRSQHQAQVVGARREYLAYLADLRGTVRQAARQQRRAAEWVMPDPSALAVVAEEGSRVWERGPDHDDFLMVRVGQGAQPLCLELEAPETAPLAQLDPVAASAAHRFLVTHRVQRDVPVGVDLRSVARVEVTGGEDEARALARALVSQAAVFHSPEHLQIAVLTSERNAAAWDWAKWLPHTHSARVRDAVGPARMIGTALTDIEGLLPEDLRERPRFGPGAEPSSPHVLVVVDGGHVPGGNAILTPDGVLGVTVLELPETWADLDTPSTLRLGLGVAPASGPNAGRAPMEVLRVGHEPYRVVADQLAAADAEAAARRLMPLHIEQGPARADGATTSSELTDLLGIGDIRDLDLGLTWRPRLPRDRLRVPIGLTMQGQPIALDIKESAQQGMGPHGLIIGATGSGKSEVLRTLVLALALTHSSEDLNFVLVDFKGGATFAGMADMPHVSAIITNLGEELTLVDRMQDALQGEMVRRQELLRAAGNFSNVTEYEKARANGRTDLDPLPALLIVCDEFSELLSAKPEFVDLFVTIGRLGRSLQMHLLLSSQRLEEGRLRGLESHLSYRIGLRTFSAAESRTVLGVPDAYTLPSVPGMGFLKPDTTTMVQFRAAYVSGPPPARRRAAHASGPAGPARLEPFTAAPVLSLVSPVSAAPAEAPVEESDERATFDIAVERMRGKGPAAHQVWLPPLVVPSTFDQLMPDLVADPRLGLVSPTWRAAGDLTVPLGIVDRPLEQRRENLTVSLGGAGGHLAVVGGPRTGKSTLLRSVVTGLALTRTPQEAQVYVLDFGGGTFSPLARLPHVAGVAGRSEPDVVRRVVAELRSLVDAREQYFRAHGIDSIETYRARRLEGRADDGYGDLFLVVDGWGTVRAEFDELEPELQALVGRGLTYGLHLLASGARWMDFRAQVKDLLGTKIELRLGDPADSEIDRKIAVDVPKDRPGRGLAMSRHHVLAALPRIDGSPDPATLGAGVDHLVDAVAAAWHGAPGPKLRLLPEQVTLDQVRTLAQHDTSRLLLGIDEARLAPVGIDLAEESHLYAFGDGGSGKSALLRAVAEEVRRVWTPDGAQIFAVDLRRSLLGEIPGEYLAGYLTTQEQATEEIAALAAYLRGRLPGPDVTPEQLRARSWWTGAEVFVLVDDYDLVATSAGNPLAPLVPLLAQAGDVGLHLVLTRRTGGAGRAMYEPVLQALRDLAAPGLVLAGSPDEGALVGAARPTPGVPGRGQLVTRDGGRQVVQLAFSAPTH